MIESMKIAAVLTIGFAVFIYALARGRWVYKPKSTHWITLRENGKIKHIKVSSEVEQ